jgi:hypothetical protein
MRLCKTWQSASAATCPGADVPCNVLARLEASPSGGTVTHEGQTGETVTRPKKVSHQIVGGGFFLHNVALSMSYTC